MALESGAHLAEVMWAGAAAAVAAASLVLVLAARLRRARQREAAAQARLQRVSQDLDRARKRAGDLLVLAKSAKAIRNEFLSNISHEVRTPMNTIMGMTDLALATELDPKQRHYLERVHEASDSLMQLLNDLLDLAKIHARRFELFPVAFQLRDCLSNLMEKFEAQAARKGLRLRFQVASDVPPVLVGDPGRLRQVVGVLVSNAVKFTEKGEVEVLIDVQERAGDEVTLHVAVSDTGPGIPPEKHALVFEAFRQADGSETRPHGGCGMGLAIASQLADVMGGRVWLESDVGQGSTFHFTGRLRARREASAPPAPLDPARLEGLQVLVVHSDATVRKALTEMLADLQMEPASVAGGQAALETLTKASEEGRPFPLVVLNAAGPAADGFALAGKILNDPGLGRPRVTAIAAAGKRGDAARCRQLGISAYLTVPIGQAELAQSLLMAIEEPPSQEPTPTLVTKHSLRETRPGSRPPAACVAAGRESGAPGLP